MEQESLFGKFCSVLSQGCELTVEDLPMVDALLSQYPFFTLPAVMMLRADGLAEETRRRLRTAVALNAPDSNSLIKLIDPDGRKFASFYPAEHKQETPSTEDALDRFLDQYGNIDKHEQVLLERLIFNPVPDYSHVLARDEAGVDSDNGPVSEQDAMLDAFLASQDAAVRKADEEAAASQTPSVAAPDTDAPLSESLAKIYIGKGRYDKAYEIIYQLSLNFPKKSVYFADQLRFLRKLMYIKECQNKK